MTCDTRNRMFVVTCRFNISSMWRGCFHLQSAVTSGPCQSGRPMFRMQPLCHLLHSSVRWELCIVMSDLHSKLTSCVRTDRWFCSVVIFSLNVCTCYKEITAYLLQIIIIISMRPLKGSTSLIFWEIKCLFALWETLVVFNRYLYLKSCLLNHYIFIPGIAARPIWITTITNVQRGRCYNSTVKLSHTQTHYNNQL